MYISQKLKLISFPKEKVVKPVSLDSCQHKDQMPIIHLVIRITLHIQPVHIIMVFCTSKQQACVFAVSLELNWSHFFNFLRSYDVVHMGV